MLRRLLLILLSLVLVVAALGAGLVGLLVWSPGTLKPAIERLASAQLGREVTIAGAIRVDPGRITTVEIEGLRVAAPEWAEAQNLAEVPRLKVGLDLGSLFGSGGLHLTEVEVEAPRVALERDAQGRTSWPAGAPDTQAEQIQASEEPGGTALPRIDELTVTDGEVSYRDAITDLQLTASVATQAAEGDRPPAIVVDGQGTMGGDPIELAARLGSPTLIGQGGQPLPIEARVQLPGTELTVAGQVRDPAALRGIEITVGLASPDPRPLLELAGRPVEAELPPLEAHARLVRPEAAFELSELRASWGESRVEGNLSYDPTAEPPRVRGRLTAPRLDLVPLWPVLTAGPEEEAPSAENPLAALAGYDAEVELATGEVRLPQVALQGTEARLRVAGDRLTVEPLRVRLPEGEIAGRVATGPFQEPFAAEVALDVTGVNLAEAVRIDQPLAGVVDGRLTGTVRGTEVEALLRDSQLRFEGRARGLRAPYFQAEVLETVAQLEGGRVTLDPLRADLPEGRLEGRLAMGPFDQELVIEGDLRAESARLQTFLGEDQGYAGAITGTLQGTLHVGSLDDLLARSQVRFEGRVEGLQIPQAELGTIETNARLENGRIVADPLRADLPQGRVVGRIEAGPFGQGFTANIDLTAEGVDLAAIARSDAFAGVLNADIEGTVEGSTPAEILTQSRLELRGEVDQLRLPQIEAGVPRATLVATLDPERPTAFRMVAEGQAGDMPVRLAAWGASAERLRANEGDYPVTLELDAGENRARVNGTVGLPLRADSPVRADVLVEGQDPAPVMDLLQLPQLELPPYRVAGTLIREGTNLRLVGLDGRVGDSDIGGDLTVALGGERPAISGELRSELIDADDFGGLVGAEPGTGAGETASAGQEAEAAQEARDGQVIPDEPLEPSRWRVVDLDLDLRAEEVRAGQIPIDSFTGSLLLEDGLLRLAPFQARAAQGRIEGRLELDGRTAPIQADVEVDLRRLSVARLLNRLDVDVGTFGTLSGRARGGMGLEGTGLSIAQILANADGEAIFVMEGGSIDRTIVTGLGFDLLGVLGSVLGVTSDQVELRCTLADFVVRDGIVNTRALLIDTPVAVVGGDGTINLETERIDITLLARPKRTVAVPIERTGITITGTLANPQVDINPAELALRGAAAATLGVLARPFGTILDALTQDQDQQTANPCNEALASLQEQ